MRILLFLLCVGQVPGAGAARVTDLYAALVPAGDGVSQNRSALFGAALRQVLVKVTGRRDVATDPVVMSRFASADTFVEQYRTNSDGSLWVLFDQAALRRTLDSLEQPVWGAERPLTLVWLVMDYGDGRRDILAAEPDVDTETGAGPEAGAGVLAVSPPVPGDREERQATVREILENTARERGLPMILPIVDSEELDIVSISDVWGGFTESLVLASQRYGVDAILVGRAQVRTVATARVRWTLIRGEERFDWDGDIASGPDRIADFFAARLATASGAPGGIRLQVDGVNSFDDYGRLSRYLSALDVIEDYSVDEVADQTVIFSLLVRGDADRLMRSIALRRVLQPIDDSPGSVPRALPADSFASAMPNLHYVLLAGP